ncbi:sodium channel protein Nach-like [Schistocerca piceifrons]|uniref:sodium channel protein Nach-like n=1 Tax=Schistocerca piceifrons TaxID=274613 RepID=UPI001F5F6213|nr:sodium channel protein Nach-like [Schistocerca piceifrons]
MLPARTTVHVEAVPPQGKGIRKATGIVAVFQQFCLNTSQHGYKYIALPDRVFVERLLWATAVAAALVTSASLVWLALQQHNSRPTLIDIETSHYPVWNFPFPAVTICPTNKVHKGQLRNLLSEWRIPHGTSREQLRRDAAYVPALLGRTVGTQGALARLAAAISANNLTVADFMQKVAPQCDQVVIKCQFKGLQRHCQKLFKTVLTECGVCCSFNYRAARPAMQQRFNSCSFRNSADNLNDVVRMSACGRQMGLSMLIKDDRNDYVTTTEASHGVKVLVHDALNVPAETSAAWLASPGQEVLLSLQPQLMYATQAAQLERPGRRGCLLREERPLDLERAYSSHNCRHDCRNNRTWQLCACLPFHVYDTGQPLPQTAVLAIQEEG